MVVKLDNTMKVAHKQLHRHRSRYTTCKNITADIKSSQ